MIEDKSTFDKFMLGYWNQAYDLHYSSISDALFDFREMEGIRSALKLANAFRSALADEAFPKTIDHDHSNVPSFWRDYDVVITLDQAEEAISFFGMDLI